MKVSVVIVNYNGIKYIKDCVDSVLQSRMKDFEVIVVDNGSTDASGQYLQKKYGHRIKLVQSRTNLFFTGGSNLGARKSQGEWLVFLNSDTVVDKNWLTEIVKLAKHKRIIQPKIKIYQTDKIDCVWGDYFWPGWGRAHGRGETDKGQYEVNRKADYANGTCLMIEKKFFFELGGFDDIFKFFYEDVDLNLRARKQGGQAWYCAKAVIEHKGSLSFKQNVASDIVQYYYRRNRLVTVIKNFKGLDKWVRLGAIILTYIGIDKKRISLKAVLDGAGEGLRDWFNQIRFRETKGLVKKDKFSWLDLGCGQGELVQFIQEQGIQAVGVDKKQGVRIEGFKPEKKYQVISMYHVLEHIKRPERVLKQIKQWLKPGGVLVVEVPVVGNLTEKWLEKEYLAYWDKTHLYFWTKPELKRLLEQSGLKIIKQGQTWQEFPYHVIRAGFKRGLVKGLVSVVLWLPLKMLSITGFNDEIVRFYCLQRTDLCKRVGRFGSDGGR